MCLTEKNATGVADNPRTECFLEGCAPWATEGVRVSHHQMKRANTPTAPPYPPPLPPAGASQPPSTYTPRSQTRALPFISICLPFPSGDESAAMRSVCPSVHARVCGGAARLRSFMVLIYNIQTSERSLLLEQMERVTSLVLNSGGTL